MRVPVKKFVLIIYRAIHFSVKIWVNIMLIFQSTSKNEQKDRVYFVVCVVITAAEIGAPSVTISPN